MAPMAPLDDVHVAVVGGGITGLAAAYELHRRDVPFVLLEGTPRLGGMIRTEAVDGFTIDAGPDSMLVHKPAALALCREVGLGPRLIPTLEPRAAYVLRHGRLRRLARGSVLGIPTRPGPLALDGPLSWAGRLRMALDLALPPRDSGDDESVAAFFRRRFGRQAVDFLAEPLLAGIHAGDVERLSVRALFPTLVEAERTAGSVIRGLRRQSAGRARRGGSDGPFRSLPGGLGELVTAVARHLPPASVRCGSAVEAPAGSLTLFTEALTHGTARWDGDYERRTLLYKYCVSNMSWGMTRVTAPEGIELTPRRQQLLAGPGDPVTHFPSLFSEELAAG